MKSKAWIPLLVVIVFALSLEMLAPRLYELFPRKLPPPPIELARSYGGSGNDWARAIQQTTDGGYIVAAHTESSDGDVTLNRGLSDYWVIKLNAQGGIVWQKTYGGSGYDTAASIEQTPDGGYIVAGSSSSGGWASSSDGDVSGKRGITNYWIVKLDAEGKLLWQRPLGGSMMDQANSVQQTTDGGYIVAGDSISKDGDVSGNRGNADYWIVKLNVRGKIVWQKTLGGSGSDIATSIQQTTDGGYIIAGHSDSKDGDVSGNHGGYDYWIVKLVGPEG